MASFEVFSGAFPITPGTAFPNNKEAKAIFVGGTGGSITGITTAGDSITISGLLTGTILPVSFSSISAAVATSLVGLY